MSTTTTHVPNSDELKARLDSLEEAEVIDPLVDAQIRFAEGFEGYLDGIFIEAVIPKLGITFVNDGWDVEASDARSFADERAGLMASLRRG